MALPQADAQMHGRMLGMECASLLREMMWTMVSELHSDIEADFAAYMAEMEPGFEAAWTRFKGGRG